MGKFSLIWNINIFLFANKFSIWIFLTCNLQKYMYNIARKKQADSVRKEFKLYEIEKP